MTPGVHGRIHNFSAGPAVLPVEVVEEVREALPNLQGTGLGLMETSHRSATFTAIVERARERVRRILALPDDATVLFLQGGASLQFAMVPANLLQGGCAEYLDTGAWSAKAIEEARHFGRVRVPWSGREGGYRAVPSPDAWEPDPTAVYTHVTTNNTIYGTAWPEPATIPGRLVADMSSDIASRRIDGSRYDVIYAGAQKNLGPSGVTLVCLSAWALERSARDLPSMLAYRVHADKGSLFNTPNTLGIFALERVLAWIERRGLDEIEAANARKAQRLYALLDSSDFWRPHAEEGSRSRMNVTWRLADPELEPVLLREAEAEGLAGLKGHRSVGGLRASLYNACPEEAVEDLVDFLRDFERRRG